MTAAATITRTSPDITVNGAALPPKWYEALRQMRIHRELCLVGRGTFRFIDHGYELAEDSLFSLGSPVKVSIQGDGALFTGEVVGASIEHEAGHPPELVITVDDVGYKLAHETVTKIYLQMKAGDIISQLASESGLLADVDEISSVVHEHIMQRSTNLEFIDMLVRRFNGVWWIDDQKLVVNKAGTTTNELSLDGEANLKDFSVRASALRPGKVRVRGWDPAEKKEIVGDNKAVTVVSSSPFLDKFAGVSSPLSSLENKVSEATSPNPNEQGEAELVATGRLNEMQTESGVAKGTVVPGNADISLGTKLTVTKVGPMNGTYLVNAVEHIFSSSGLTTRFVAGPMRPAGLVDTLGPSRVAEGLTKENLITAVVSDVKDPDNRGRVKIKYIGVGDNLASDWARVLALGGGDDRGMVFQPEVGDEVLVGFERGDLRHPVVFGGLYATNQDFAADDKLTNDSGKVVYRRMTSRKKHVLEFGDGDTPKDQYVLIKLGTIGHSLRLGADEMTVELESGKPFTLKAGTAKIAIDAQGNIDIEGGKITVKAQQGIDLESQLDFKAKGTTGISLQGLKAELKGDAEASVEASGPTQIKGAIVKIN